jgi:transposase
MTDDLAALLFNPERLKGKILAFASAYKELDAQNSALLTEKEALVSENARVLARLETMRQENEKLLSMLSEMLRARFGPRSERLDPDQLRLELEAMAKAAGEAAPAPAQEPDAPEKPSEASSKGGKPRGKANRNRGALPAHLPRIEVRIDVEDKACPCCGGALHVIGEDRTEMLDMIPVQYRVKSIVRPRYGCRGCGDAVVQAPAPQRPIEGGLPTEALLIAIAVSKFAWRLPLNRQIEMMRAQGVALDRSTLSLWIGKTAWWLKPLYELLKADLLSRDKLFCDETRAPVWAPGKTKRGQLWAIASDDRPWQGPEPPAVVYAFAPDRRGARAEALLQGFTGVLQVDGYTVYQSLAAAARKDAPITLAFCLAHARRKFYEFYKKTKSPIAGEALQKIMAIYAIEKRIRGMTAAERLAVRQAESKPLMEAFKPWLEERLAEFSRGSPLAKAIRYALNHWEGLCVFLGDGRVEVDSNTVEREMRTIALTRKNALFAGSEGGADAWAILASLIGSARLNDVDPQAWLTDVLERLVSGRTKINQLHELLPWTWNAAQNQVGAAETGEAPDLAAAA